MLKRIQLDQITRNPDQPRQHFDERALNDLAESISQNGLAQPITVRPVDGDKPWMVIMGERRYRAHLILQARGEVDSILAHVRRMDDREMHINAILENLQRAEVSPIEEAVAYQRAIDEHGFSVPELAQRLGISQHWRITDRLRLLQLTPDNRALVTKGIVSLTQAFHMARLCGHGQKLFLELVAQGLATTNAAAQAAADQIEAKLAQAEMPMFSAPALARASVRGLESRIDALGKQLQPFFDDGPYRIEGMVAPDEARRCIEKLRLLKRHMGQIQGELERAASVGAAA